MKRPRRIKIVVGTRGSELALTQTQLVVQGLQTRWADLKFEVKVIKTRGDDSKTAIPDIRAGRKGLFTGEIERALVTDDIDLAVHSAKDLPSTLAPRTEIAAVLPRAIVDDVLVATAQCDLNSLATDGIVATGSVRRKHQLRWKRPDLEIVDLRGNVPTRLRKLATDRWHAIILAHAGLERLGLNSGEGQINFEGSEFSIARLSREIFLPAGGQGVIAMQIRSGDEQLREIVDAINDFDTRLALRAEREFLRLLNADCNQPVGVLAVVDGTIMKIRGQIFALEATTPREGFVQGPSEDAEKLAAQLLEKVNGE
ncbi:MAG TPA: hydroxymethylbilane synthase [Chthoniobacterales bacterium]|jgi:hydroxymethylbilane synthase|nr:hydroxymethylbilane synthase [Chthoniobacterales bacterium]